ncbi:MAG: ATP synthase F1 subunit epsilon [Planctomycetaceae bacterium]|nr:MAG: ATP synthase F1 subunit epsilon [Planctomycetaceae bacterium]
MPQYKKIFCCEILAPTGKILGVEAVLAVLPLADGMLGVLADHSPLIGIVGAGLLTITQPDDKVHEYFVAGGFAHVHSNAVSLLVEECTPISALDAAQIQEEIARAESLPAETFAQQQQRRKALSIANTKLKLTQKKAG